MDGLRRESFRLGSRGQGIYDKGEKGDGICKACGQWAADLDSDGKCKDRECKRRRLERAAALGKAIEVTVGDVKTIIFTDTSEPLPQVLPTREVAEQSAGPVCSHCGSDYKRPGDHLCVRCRRAAGPPKVQAKGKRFGRRKP